MNSTVNLMFKLDNGIKYVILKQAIYKNEDYYIASKLDHHNNPIADDITFFHQIDFNGQVKMEEVTDIKLMKFLYNYMQL